MTVQSYIYRRFSTDEQEHGAADTLLRQTLACEAFIAQKGWAAAGPPLTDKGKSAFNGHHLLPDAELGKFVAAVHRGEITKGSVLVAERLDRLSRLPVPATMAWIHSLTSAGILIAIADTNDVYGVDQSMESFLTTAIRAGVSHEESRKKSDATTKSRRILWDSALNRTGKWVNLANRIPTWLEREPTLDGFKVVEERADIVRLIYQLSADGVGVNTITGYLNSTTPPTPPFASAIRYKDRVHTWGRSAVRQILTSPTVEGDFRPISGPYFGQVIANFYPRIVSADIVARAREDLSARRRTAGKSAASGSTNLFAGVTKCGECGRRATLTSSVQKGRTYSYVRCEAAGEKRCSNRNGYAYSKFEQTVLDLILDLALDDRFFAMTGELKAGRERKAEVEKALAENRSYRKDMMRAFKLNDREAQELIDEAADVIEALEAELVVVEADIRTASGKVGNIEHLRRVNDIREAARSANEATRVQARSKLRLALSSIVMTVDIERDDEGVKVFTVILQGGVLGFRIDTKGHLRQAVSEALGEPLWTFLSPDQKAELSPLISRIEKLRANRPTD